MTTPHRVIAAARLAVLATVGAGLCACVTPPPPRVVTPPPPPPPNTTVYAYPLQGQTPQQLDRDRYECYVWAKGQTGFDPSAPNVPAEDRVRVVSGPPGPPPGATTAFGAITGAFLGAAVSSPRNAGVGALAGALIGGAVGASAEAANQPRVTEVAVPDRAQMIQIQRQAADYRRAMSACLEGRGYSVR
jgi:hypothetical protein